MSNIEVAPAGEMHDANLVYRGRERYRDLMKAYAERFNEAVREKDASLTGKYGREACLKYKMYHVLIGSTFGKDECPHLDFPGDDSVDSFLNDYH